jgi:hypothetical protein
MFPKRATTLELKAIAEQHRDVQWATRKWPAPMCRFQVGQRWRFWTEGDPRTDDGIQPLASYVCVDSGDDEAKWRKEKL